jgi:hypothetical protein
LLESLPKSAESYRNKEIFFIESCPEVDDVADKPGVELSW